MIVYQCNLAMTLNMSMSMQINILNHQMLSDASNQIIIFRYFQMHQLIMSVCLQEVARRARLAAQSLAGATEVKNSVKKDVRIHWKLIGSWWILYQNDVISLDFTYEKMIWWLYLWMCFWMFLHVKTVFHSLIHFDPISRRSATKRWRPSRSICWHNAWPDELSGSQMISLRVGKMVRLLPNQFCGTISMVQCSGWPHKLELWSLWWTIWGKRKFLSNTNSWSNPLHNSFWFPISSCICPWQRRTNNWSCCY